MIAKEAKAARRDSGVANNFLRNVPLEINVKLFFITILDL